MDDNSISIEPQPEPEPVVLAEGGTHRGRVRVVDYDGQHTLELHPPAGRPGERIRSFPVTPELADEAFALWVAALEALDTLPAA